MRINFYDTRLSDDGRTILVKEKAVNYDIEKADNPKDIVLMMQTLLHMDKLAEEHSYMLGLNNACKIIGIFFISKGTVNGSLMSARELYIRALIIGASMIIVCHNHPSGNAYASDSDIATTNKIREAGELLGIRLIDHIIIGDGYYSFNENGMFNK